MIRRGISMLLIMAVMLLPTGELFAAKLNCSRSASVSMSHADHAQPVSGEHASMAANPTPCKHMGCNVFKHCKSCHCVSHAHAFVPVTLLSQPAVVQVEPVIGFIDLLTLQYRITPLFRPPIG